MELPTDVLVHNELLGVKGSRGRLLQVAHGYYELNLLFGERTHRVLLPVAQTVLISDQAEETPGPGVEVER
jgi:hypothetical protein